MSTEERLARLEERIEALEQIIGQAKEKLAAAAGSAAGKKVLAVLGVRL